MKLREVPGPHYQLPGQERPERRTGPTAGELQEKERTGAEPWAERMRRKLREPVKTAGSWAELEARLEARGLHLKKRGRGLVITDGERLVNEAWCEGHQAGATKEAGPNRGGGPAAVELARRFGPGAEPWEGSVNGR